MSAESITARRKPGKKPRMAGNPESAPALVLHKWDMDERLLVLDRYFDVRFGVKMERKLAGDELGALIGVSRESIMARFKVFMNFDPEMRARGIKGISKWGKQDKEAWEWYLNHGRERLRQEAQAIRQRREAAN